MSIMTPRIISLLSLKTPYQIIKWGIICFWMSRGSACIRWGARGAFALPGISKIKEFPLLKVEIMTFQGFYRSLPLLDLNPYTGAAWLLHNKSKRFTENCPHGDVYSPDVANLRALWTARSFFGSLQTIGYLLHLSQGLQSFLWPCASICLFSMGDQVDVSRRQLSKSVSMGGGIQLYRLEMAPLLETDAENLRLVSLIITQKQLMI